MKIVVTGGAGYIGSFMVRKLRDSGHEVIIVDDLSSGHVEAVEDFRLEKINLVDDSQKLDLIFKTEKIDAVIHMASFIQMGESYKNPSKYYRNNVIGFISLLDTMVKNGCLKLVISSSAGVYGNPEKLPILENDPKNPLNPYGETKYILERVADDYDLAYGLKYVALRYFNAAGAMLDGSIGEAHPEESHLIPTIIKKALSDEEIHIFGNDYNTPDGTCVRDYIHVLDLVEVHSLAIDYLDEGKSNIFNVGVGKGYSNKEILDEIGKRLNKELKVVYYPRRQGDADSLYASNEKAVKTLGWKPKYKLDDIVDSAIKWHTNNPKNYSEKY